MPILQLLSKMELLPVTRILKKNPAQHDFLHLNHTSNQQVENFYLNN